MSEIKITKTTNPKQKPPMDSLVFGKYFSDHMFTMNYSENKDWHDARIEPYADFTLSPATMALHYGQAIFEGMKAYYAEDGRTLLFRPDKNVARLNMSCERLCIPPLNTELALDAIKELVSMEKSWIPTKPDTSLYIRPFIFATDPFLGVRPSSTFQFSIICSPCGSYYPEGINPVKIYVEDEYVRAVRGGVGHTKTCGNYAASLKAQQDAKKKGYSQVLWLDGIEHKYIEEVGAMNVFFVIGDEVITPSLEGSILPGITRMSSIEMLQSEGYKVTERRLSIDELLEANRAGRLQEAFGTGTAAVISPIGELCYMDEKIIINNGKIGNISAKVYDKLTGIQYGRIEDTFGWTVEVTEK